ncbi:MAG TPA: methyltransferase domain-containing protein [Pyrinomonadaceae bacterium]|jgi:SAM-dependent methyltransferase
MRRLSEKEYWDSVHVQEKEGWETKQPKDRGLAPPSALKRLKERMKALLGDRATNLMAGYEDHLIWNVVYEKYLAAEPGAKVLEVGSAPGEHLVQLSQKFGLEPYGVDYSESGVKLNKEIFRAHNLDPGNVIHADFFSDEFQEQYRESFDLVISRGFIEHFTDVEDTIRKHLNLLAKGGRLVVIIPNLRGLNYVLGMFFHKEVIAIHNLEIMRKDVFARLFENKRLRPLFCDYNGVFSFYLFNTKEHSPMRHALKAGFHAQLILNAAFHLMFKDRPVEHRWFSPSLIFIGIKEV